MIEEEIKTIIKKLQTNYTYGFECRDDGNYYSEESIIAVLKEIQ